VGVIILFVGANKKAKSQLFYLFMITRECTMEEALITNITERCYFLNAQLL